MSSYRTRDQRVADEVSASYGSCLKCQSSTLLETLGQYGGRCHPCFEAYCNDGTKPVHGLTSADKVAILGKMRRAVAASRLAA